MLAPDMVPLALMLAAGLGALAAFTLLAMAVVALAAHFAVQLALAAAAVVFVVAGRLLAGRQARREEA